MTPDPIICIHIGRSTWQGQQSEARKCLAGFSGWPHSAFGGASATRAAKNIRPHLAGRTEPLRVCDGIGAEDE